MLSQTSLTAWLFPGQGSQYAGMGRELCSTFPPAQRILDLASTMSGLPLKEYSWQGPEALLTRTDVLQPALTAVNLACVELLRAFGIKPDMVAGHSLGEFSGLYAAGVLTLEDTLSVVIARGRLMHKAASLVRGGMLAVKDLSTCQVETVMASIDDLSKACIANYNAPGQLVISGDLDTLNVVAGAARALGGSSTLLNVEGPWHSPWLREAARDFSRLLRRVDFHDPCCTVFLNSTGCSETNAPAIRRAVSEQITSPVFWQAIVEGMIDAGARSFIEAGPGKVLKGLMRRICQDPACTIRGVENPKSLDFLGTERARLQL